MNPEFDPPPSTGTPPGPRTHKETVIVCAIALLVIAGAGFFVLRSIFAPSPSLAPRAHARNDCNMIVVATGSFLTEYERWPLPDGTPEREVDNGAFMDVLRGIDTRINSRKIVFYEGWPGRFQGSVFVDSWQRPYHIICDTDGDGLIKIGGEMVKRKVVVWSSGPNGKDEQGTCDDVASWR